MATGQPPSNFHHKRRTPRFVPKHRRTRQVQPGLRLSITTHQRPTTPRRVRFPSQPDAPASITTRRVSEGPHLNPGDTINAGHPHFSRAPHASPRLGVSSSKTHRHSTPLEFIPRESLATSEFLANPATKVGQVPPGDGNRTAPIELPSQTSHASLCPKASASSPGTTWPTPLNHDTPAPHHNPTRQRPITTRRVSEGPHLNPADTINADHSHFSGDPMRLRDLTSLRQKRIDTRRRSNSSSAIHLPHPNSWRIRLPSATTKPILETAHGPSPRAWRF
jgi:hypothetical protein